MILDSDHTCSTAGGNTAVVNKIPHSKIPKTTPTPPIDEESSESEAKVDPDGESEDWTFASSFLYSLSLITTMGEQPFFTIMHFLSLDLHVRGSPSIHMTKLLGGGGVFTRS